MQKHITSTKPSTLHPSRARFAAGGCALLLSVVAASAEFTISTSPGLFTPSFRDLTNGDLGNTTSFGWGPSTGWGLSGNFRFDGITDDELINNPPALQHVGGLTGTLNQQGTDDILSSSNNIYTSSFTEITLDVGIPTNGTIGTGFTTIIIQGHTAFGGYPDDAFVFPDLGGDAADLVVGVNSIGQGQFWAKYEIAGNAANYLADVDLLGGFVSLSELTVDTQWSSSSFAPDTAIAAVPEPSAALALLSGTATLPMLRRRKSVG